MSDASLLASIKTGYLEALAADAVNPRPDYSLDGQTVSRSQWRESLLSRIKEIDSLIQSADPYELRGNIG